MNEARGPVSYLLYSGANILEYAPSSVGVKTKTHTGSTLEGKQAARGIAIELLATLQSALGDLDKIKRIVKLLVVVNSTPNFTEPHVVANGASELFLEIFGERGAHARSSFGVAQIPFGACVEIELIAEVIDRAYAPKGA